MASILPRVAVVLALLTGGGWAAAGAPAPGNIWSPSAPSAPSAAAVEATPTPSISGTVTDEVPFIENGRHVNTVEAQNRRDASFELQGRADYVREKQDDVTPGNQAVARSTCIDCQTIALALQLVVYRQGATIVAPRNFAYAINEQCTRCLTMARAIQYVIPVTDPHDLPGDVKALIHELNVQMNELERIRALNQGNVQQVSTQLDSIITRFDHLRAFLRDDRREASTLDLAPVQTPPPATATPPPVTATPQPPATNTPIPAATTTAGAQPAVAATGTPVPATATPLPTATPLATATAVPPTATRTPLPAATP